MTLMMISGFREGGGCGLGRARGRSKGSLRIMWSSQAWQIGLGIRHGRSVLMYVRSEGYQAEVAPDLRVWLTLGADGCARL